MKRNTSVLWRIKAVAMVVLLLAQTLLPPAALAQELRPYNTRAAFRDAAIDAHFGRLFVAAYDRNEIWVYDPASLERIETVPTGQGPSLLAVSSDGYTLACVNRIDSTVSLFRLASTSGTPALEKVATLNTGEGPVSLAPAKDNHFIVANSFSDSLSLIDAGNATIKTVEKVAEVPVDAALNASALALVSRTQNNLQLFDADTFTLRKSAALGGVPNAVKTLNDDSFVVSTDNALLVIDAQSGEVKHRANLTANSFAVDSGKIYALHGAQVTTLDAQLNVLHTTNLSNTYTRIIADKGVLAALNPREMSMALANTSQMAYQPEAQTAVTPVLVAQAEPQVSEPPSEDTETVEDAEVILLDASEETSAPEVSQPPVEEAPVQETTTQFVAESAETAPNEVKAAPSTYRSMPISRGGVRTPRPSRPSSDPRQPITKEDIMETLLRPTEFASTEAGFQEPDWSEPFRDVEFDSGEQDLENNSMDLQGNVRLSLGNMHFNADAFKYDEGAGEITTSGNVKVLQGESTLTANEMHYVMLPASELPPPLIFEVPYTESDMSKKRLTLGRVTAQNLHVVEPTRVMKADSFEFDVMRQTGAMQNAFGKAGLFYYGAEELVITGANSFEAKDLWVTPCECDEDNPPAYRLRLSEVKVVDGEIVSGKNARLQIRNTNTPIYIPFVGRRFGSLNPMALDLDSGRQAELGFFVNLGQPIQFSNDVTAGPRFFFSENEGVGLGADLYYNFMNTPSSKLFRTKGTLKTLYTTEDRGYFHWYHQYAHSNDLMVKMQVEQWSDEDFYKDFFFDQYRDRTTPRTFANVTWRKPEFIVQGTLDVNTHNWVTQRESLPEASFSLMERQLADRLYLSFDTIAGHYELEPRGIDTARIINVARLTMDLDAGALSITPFLELEASAFSETLDGDSAGRFSSTIGTTLQTRLHKTYPGRLGFSGFKHIILPSITLSYSPDSTMDFEDNPRLDTWDARDGRTRIETKIDNVFYGKDAESGDVWQVGRISLYQGNDITSDSAKAADYELEIDIRPRPWWGWQFVAERHVTSGEDLDFGDRGYFEYLTQRTFERVFDQPIDSRFYETRYGDYNRILTELYYDNTEQGGRYSGRVGFALTETNGFVFNREILYGMGYRINDKWALSFEHRYDLDDNELRSQTYEVRRSFQCWESSVRFRDRQSGFDVDFAISLTAFPGTKVSL